MKFIVGNKISDKKPLKLDSDILADTRALICSSSGGGKSRLLRLIAEQVGASIQTLIIDPEGEFPTLREHLDILIVGENGDVQANVKSAALLARRLAETGVSAVLDIYDLPGKGDPWDKRRAFVAEFLNALMNLPKSSNHPMLIIVDEAHQFAPEGKGSEAANASRSAINSLMSAGRKRGFGGILATQRISKIHKDSIADARNIFIGGTTLDIDQERAGDMIGMSKRESVHLRDLAPGQFYCYGPATGSKEIFQFISGEIKTTHPKAGQRSSISVPKASTKIAAISEKLGDLPQEAQNEIETMDALKRDNIRLQREMQARPVHIEPKNEIKEVEVAVIPPDQIDALNDSLEEIKNQYNILSSLRDEISSAFKVPSETLQVSASSLANTIEQAKLINQRKLSIGVDRSNGKDKTVFTSIKNEKDHLLVTGSGEVTKTEQKVINAIAWLNSIGIMRPSKNAIAALAGYKLSGTFANLLGGLRTKNLIDYLEPNTASLTQSGEAVATYPSMAPTPADMQDRVRGVLANTEWKVLEQTIKVYPREISKEDLAEVTGYKMSGTFANLLGGLRTKGMIDYPRPNFVKAEPFLFLE